MHECASAFTEAGSEYAKAIAKNYFNEREAHWHE